MKRLLVVQPDAKADLDRMAPWLEEEGLSVEVVRPFLGETVPARATADGVIVLGGSMGAMDDGEFPWLTTIKALLADSVSRSVPTLGVCLGAQLLAVATGGEVRPGAPGLECGVVDVRWRSAAADDPLVGDLREPFRAASMHYDAITRLPTDAVLLGTGETYPNQVFRIGRAWGVQFHPEVSPEKFASWRSLIDPAARDHYDERGRHFDGADSTVQPGIRAFARRFGTVVHAGS